MPRGEVHRPAWVPSEAERRLVEHYVSLGYTQEQVGALMEKSVDTLARHCRRELDLGKLKVNAKIGGALFQKAMGGDTSALIFWAKTQMGWKETDRHEHTGSIDVGSEGARLAAEEAVDRVIAQLAILSGAAPVSDESRLLAGLRLGKDRLQ